MRKMIDSSFDDFSTQVPIDFFDSGRKVLKSKGVEFCNIIAFFAFDFDVSSFYSTLFINLAFQDVKAREKRIMELNEESDDLGMDQVDGVGSGEEREPVVERVQVSICKIFFPIRL